MEWLNKQLFALIAAIVLYIGTFKKTEGILEEKERNLEENAVSRHDKILRGTDILDEF